MLRINLSIPPTATPNRLGFFGGDTAGFPNGRRLEDDVVDIAERAVAGKLKGHPAGDLLGDRVDKKRRSEPHVVPVRERPAERLRQHEGPAEALTRRPVSDGRSSGPPNRSAPANELCANTRPGGERRRP
jgi:hypothetical protein